MSAPDLSVVVPAYNEEGRLGESLEKVLDYFEGRGIAFEILVADDGSRDRTAAVARTYRRAKIVLNAHHAQMREGVNMRTFEIPAAGAFQLCDAKGRLGELLEIGREVAVYQGVDDLVFVVEPDEEGVWQVVARPGGD